MFIYAVHILVKYIFCPVTATLEMQYYLGKDETVIVGVAWVFGSVLHGMKKDHRHDLCNTAA